MHDVVWALTSDGDAVELARDSDREIADVDHLLNLAAAFFEDFAAFEGDESGEVFLPFTQLVAEDTDEFTSAGAGYLSPFVESLYGLGDFSVDFGD